MSRNVTIITNDQMRSVLQFMKDSQIREVVYNNKREKFRTIKVYGPSKASEDAIVAFCKRNNIAVDARNVVQHKSIGAFRVSRSIYFYVNLDYSGT